MNILQLCDYYQHLGGAEQYMLSLSQDLENQGHTTSVVYGIKTKDTLNISGRSEYFLPTLVEENPMDREAERKLTEIVQEENPDIIYVHNVSNSAVIHYLIQKKPVVRYIHDFSLLCLNWRKILPSQDRICPFPLGFRCILNAYSNRCISRNPRIVLRQLKSNHRRLDINRRLDLQIVASSYMKSILIQNGFPPDRVKVIPYYTEPVPFDRINFKNFILFVGRLHETKGLQHLLMALRECPDELKLIVIGEGLYKKEIDKLISQKNLGHRVKFLGWLPQDKLSEYYLNCLSLVVPSLWPEPFGIVGIEALSYRKPVIAYKVGGIPDWLEDGVNGFLVERKNVTGLAQKIKYLFYNPEKARKMGEAGERKFKDSYTKERHLTSLLEAFKGLTP